MDFKELIIKRQSVRNYDPNRIVSRELLSRIVEAGHLAPSAANYQPWEYWIISDPETLQKVKETYSRQWLQDAPHILIVTGDLENAWVRADGYNSLQTDLAITLYQMILAATNEGVSTCWVSNFDPDKLRIALGLKETVQVYALTPLGYPKQNHSPSNNPMRKPVDEIARFI